MIQPPLAHTGHWLVNVAYVLPFVVFLVWLLVTVVRERRQAVRETRDVPER
ncbi:MAG: hypothetical protein ACR2FZ_06410 [Thermoleophilaceae bacterium]